MLQNRIASANVLLILMMLTAKVSCQANYRFEQAEIDNQNQELDPSKSYNRRLFGRQLNPKIDLDLMRFNQRNADNPMYRSAVAASGGSSGGRSGSPIVAIAGAGLPTGGVPPSSSNTDGPFGSMKVRIPPKASTGQESPSTSPVGSNSEKQSESSESSSSSNNDNFIINNKENEEKLHGLQRLIQQLYVAQAQVQLEVNEIQRAQGVAATAQQSLEEASNNVRVITAALHAAQQTVAAAAIRAQTAQLQLAAHDQLLFAARQRVDALSAQIVSVKAEEGIQPTKMIVDMQALLNKLKAPLPDAQKPTPVPSILGESGGQSTGTGTGTKTETGTGTGTETEARTGTPSKEGAFGASDSTVEKSNGKCPYSHTGQGYLIHFDESTQQNQGSEQNEETPNILLKETKNLQEDDGKIQQKPENEAEDQNLGYLMTKNNDLTHYVDSFLNDNSDGNNNVEEVPDDSIKRELSILNEKELRNLVDFITAMNSKDQQQNNNLVLDNKKVFAKHTDQRYINDFLNTIKTTQLANQKFKELKVNEVINKRDNTPEQNVKQKENTYDTDNEPIFNMEKAFDLNSENFQESLP